MPVTAQNLVTVTLALARSASRASKPSAASPLFPEPQFHVGFTQRSVQLLDLPRQLLFPARVPATGAGLQRPLAAGEEQITPLRDRHRRGALPPDGRRDRNLRAAPPPRSRPCPPRTSTIHGLTLSSTTTETSTADGPSTISFKSGQTMACLRNPDTRHTSNTRNPHRCNRGGGLVAHVGLHALGAFADCLGVGASLSAAVPPAGERAPHRHMIRRPSFRGGGVGAEAVAVAGPGDGGPRRSGMAHDHLQIHAAANNIDDHIAVLDAAIGRLPAEVAAGHAARRRRRSGRRPVPTRRAARSPKPWDIPWWRAATTPSIAAVPVTDKRWRPAIRRSGDVRPGAAVADLTDFDADLMTKKLITSRPHRRPQRRRPQPPHFETPPGSRLACWARIVVWFQQLANFRQSRRQTAPLGAVAHPRTPRPLRAPHDHPPTRQPPRRSAPRPHLQPHRRPRLRAHQRA